MAKDLFHEAVKTALIKDGWTITDDPLTLPFGNRKLYVDLAAEKLITAEKLNQRIAVEVKSFTGRSAMADLEKAIDQYVMYTSALARHEADRVLYLALPKEVYAELTNDQVVGILSEEMRIRLVVYNPVDQTLVRWIG
ncbi:element excision factor XisH family protein [Fibrella sp. WM1]|uniref:element excision factor XisH family protein n=1 Tax=Fibrella musci TaxID=3242485 RepID=UPI003522CBFE